LATRAIGDRRRRLAALLGRDHRSRVRAGAGLVLGRHRLDLRDGRRYRRHRRRHRDTRGRRYGSLVLRGVEVGAALLVVVFGTLLLTGFTASERIGMF